MTASRFVDTHVFRAERFSLGVDSITGRRFLSTPVSGQMAAAEYEAWFAITAQEYERFAASPQEALPFLEDCRMGRHAGRRMDRR